MTAMLTQQDDEYVLRLDREAVERLGLPLDVPLEVEEGGRIVRVAEREMSDEDVLCAMQDTNRRYGGMLQRLAK